MKTPTKARKRGRPQKHNRMEGNVNFNCPLEMLAAIDAYAEKIRASSRGHAARRLIEIAIGAESSAAK